MVANAPGRRKPVDTDEFDTSDEALEEAVGMAVADLEAEKGRRAARA